MSETQVASTAPAAAPGDADDALEEGLRKLHLVTGLSAVAWMIASLVVGTWLSNRLIAADVVDAAQAARQDSKSLANVVDLMFHELISIPQVLSSSAQLLAVIGRYDRQETKFSKLPPEQRKRDLLQDAAIGIVNKRLARVREELKYDLLYVLDKSGICVVASEASMLGLDLADREYFREAMSGETGHMFAYSRLFDRPTFFFSSPIEIGDKPMGAVVATESALTVGSRLAGTGRVSMLVDEAGMVVASSDESMLMRHFGVLTGRMPDEAALRTRYRQETLRRIPSTRPPRQYHEAQWLIDGRDVIVMSSRLPSSPYELYTLTSMQWAADVKWLHRVIGGLVVLGGLLLLLLVDRGITIITRRRHYARVTRALNDKLATANREKDRYLGIAAHDLRNPLSSTRGLSELMLQSDLEEAQRREFLETIHRTSDEMLTMVNDLLDVAVIESGKLALRYKDEDLVKLVRRRIRHLEPHAQAKQIAIKVDAQAGLRAGIDSARFSQVIDNLVSNAIKFSPLGTTVHVVLRGQGPGFVFSVQDEGPGIGEEDRKLLFKSFQKLSARPTGGEKSTGLGLAIVKKIIDAHGGTIEVDSAPGRGTRFLVTMPLVAPQGAPS